MVTDYKKSFYLVSSNSLKFDNDYSERLIFSTRTSSLLLMREDHFQEFNEERFGEIPEQVLDELIKIQAVVPKEQDELDYVVSANNAAIEGNETLDIVIQPGASCQLGCHYCGQQHTSKYMDKNLQEKVVNRIRLKIEASGCKQLNVTWYGAEPLMAVNHVYEMSEALLLVCKEYNISYTASMVTNGLSLKHNIFLNLIQKYQIKTFQITLDGVAAYHDLNRYTKKEKGPTFSIIFNNILTIVNAPGFKELDANIVIRCNVDTNNVDGLNEFIDLLAAHKLQDKISFYLVPIHNWGDNGIENSKGVVKDDFSVAEIDWMMKLLQLGFDIEILPERTKIVCSAVKKHSEVYDAYGTVSTCWEVPYTPLYNQTKFEIGHLDVPFEEDVSKTPMRNWNNDVKNSDESTCMKCNLLPVCGGSCPIHWLSGTPACPSFKFNMQDRLVLQYLRSKKVI
ncbi:radical SAM/SPASM domain-containing protein [Chitinophaga silvisoli]|uniref:SPASM domain-containing protein n=1 Tax=Chitinophaga silvisoli TaxID=2291814 RepID=A0A3E1NWX7_9BACT|nr:radical SAM protein [Chitinophaga silvisoli]RFM32422.1 SPASM domain-containing protein [Chitinophaga silvisoli]